MIYFYLQLSFKLLVKYQELLTKIIKNVLGRISEYTCFFNMVLKMQINVLLRVIFKECDWSFWWFSY